jgi:hypothetical protein
MASYRVQFDIIIVIIIIIIIIIIMTNYLCAELQTWPQVLLTTAPDRGQ